MDDKFKCARMGKFIDCQSCLCVDKVTTGGRKKCVEDSNLIHLSNVVIIASFECVLVVVLCFMLFYCYHQNKENTKHFNGF